MIEDDKRLAGLCRPISRALRKEILAQINDEANRIEADLPQTILIETPLDD